MYFAHKPFFFFTFHTPLANSYLISSSLSCCFSRKPSSTFPITLLNTTIFNLRTMAQQGPQAGPAYNNQNLQNALVVLHQKLQNRNLDRLNRARLNSSTCVRMELRPINRTEREPCLSLFFQGIRLLFAYLTIGGVSFLSCQTRKSGYKSFFGTAKDFWGIVKNSFYFCVVTLNRGVWRYGSKRFNCKNFYYSVYHVGFDFFQYINDKNYELFPKIRVSKKELQIFYIYCSILSMVSLLDSTKTKQAARFNYIFFWYNQKDFSLQMVCLIPKLSIFSSIFYI